MLAGPDISGIPEEHIAKLRENPSFKTQFDKKYGEGAAKACMKKAAEGACHVVSISIGMCVQATCSVAQYKLHAARTSHMQRGPSSSCTCLPLFEAQNRIGSWEVACS